MQARSKVSLAHSEGAEGGGMPGHHSRTAADPLGKANAELKLFVERYHLSFDARRALYVEWKVVSRETSSLHRPKSTPRIQSTPGVATVDMCRRDAIHELIKFGGVEPPVRPYAGAKIEAVRRHVENRAADVVRPQTTGQKHRAP